MSTFNRRLPFSVPGLCALCLCLQLFFPAEAHSQTRLTSQTRLISPPSPSELLSPTQIGEDFLYIVQAPLRLRHDQYVKVLGLSGLTAGVISALDRPVYYKLSGGPGMDAPPVSRHLAGLGHAYDRIGPTNFLLGTAGAFAASGLLLRNNRHINTGIRIVEAVAFTQILTGVFKQTIGRSRPFTQEGPFDAELFEFEATHAARSMPSGHTSKIFAAASVIAHQYDKWWVQVPAYTVAASAGLQRIESGKHWFSDVVLGGVLGYMVGKALAGPSSQSGPGRVSYTPVVSFGRVGLSLRF